MPNIHDEEVQFCNVVQVVIHLTQDLVASGEGGMTMLSSRVYKVKGDGAEGWVRQGALNVVGCNRGLGGAKRVVGSVKLDCRAGRGNGIAGLRSPVGTRRKGHHATLTSWLKITHVRACAVD